MSHSNILPSVPRDRRFLFSRGTYKNCVVASWHPVLPPKQSANDFAVDVVINTATSYQVIVLSSEIIQKDLA